MSNMIFNEWVIGGPPQGRMRHAAKRHGSPEASMYTVSSLCGARGGNGVVRASNTLYDPTQIDDPCTTCARRWAALYAPQIDGWTKVCGSCAQDKPVTQFHTDARTKDGLSKTCFDCHTAAAAAIKEAERFLQRASSDRRNQARATELAHGDVAAMAIFQASPLTSTFRCIAGHVLTPVVTTQSTEFFGATTDYDHAAWQCPCGTRTVGEADTDLGALHDIVDALEVFVAVARTEPVDMSGIPA